MKKIIYLIVVIVALGLIIAGCTNPVVPPTDQNESGALPNKDPGDPDEVWNLTTNTSTLYFTIQDAIDDASPGDTIIVGAGTYNEQLTINKSLNLRGAQHGADPRDGRTGDESIVTSTGTSVKVVAAGITIDGFKFTGGEKVILTDGIVDSLTMVNNIFTSFSSAAIFLNNTGESVVISKNVFVNTGSSATTCLHLDGSDVFNNIQITDNVFENNDGYGIFAGNKNFNSAGAEISGNLFSHLECGMNLSSQFSDSVIAGNTFENIGYTGMQLNLKNSKIENNTFRNIGPSPHSGYPSYSMMIFGTTWGLASSEDVTVTGNTFQYNNFADPNEVENGFRIVSLQDAAEIHVHYNNFIDGGAQTGALAFNNQGTEFADATCNWWGDISGPSGVGPGSGGAVTENVTYSPWLLGSYPGGSCGIEVDIDIKPGSFPNSINLNSKGVIPVAILGSATFDVTDVDVTTLVFGPDSSTPVHDLTDSIVYADHLQDVNLDGFTDLVCHFRTQDTGIKKTDTDATLTGETFSVNFIGTDSVNIVGK